MDVRHLLVDTHTHLPPAATLAGLTPADAARRVGGVPHSIAEIVAHMAFWQDWFRRRAAGEAAPMIATRGARLARRRRGRVAGGARRVPRPASSSWPASSSSSIPTRPSNPAFEFPMLAGYTARDVWEHVGQHNAHHMGQVVILRQFLGLWPPPAGSYTW